MMKETTCCNFQNFMDEVENFESERLEIYGLDELFEMWSIMEILENVTNEEFELRTAVNLADVIGLDLLRKIKERIDKLNEQ